MKLIDKNLLTNFTETFPEDHEERLRALEPTQSFIVQAPAGSGKTELLTQRYLTLLAHTHKSPEEILAITFTRKAANEMRCRILASLEQAAKNIEPKSINESITYQLASKALQRDCDLSWQLLENPNRLRIQTIDAFCARLTAQMPILSGFGAQPVISDNIEELYSKAAQACLASLNEMSWSSSLATLLLHLDNDFTKLERLLVEMLKKRDQWLPYILGRNLREQLEQALQNVITEQLTQLDNLLDDDLRHQLLQVLQYVSRHADESYQLHELVGLTELPQPTVTDFSKWQIISNYFLTKTKTWRNRFSTKEGLPAAVKAEILPLLQELMHKFSQSNSLHQQWVHISALPQPYYSDQQWQLIDALINLLPVVVAQLHLLFKTHNVVDHIEVSLKALQALGEADAPSDLALALDYRIRHILVDEFQDTAITQFRLLELLTAGWETNDGRTLFLVGDPMQSIYRFRKAEVALFLQAKHQGIGQIHLESLQLTVNFRAIQPLVDWTNKTFKTVFPEQDDLLSGSVAFTPAKAHKINEASLDCVVSIHPFINQADIKQGIKIVELIKTTWQNNPERTIAILVQARTHLQEIIPVLQKYKINYHAVEIEKLSNRSIIQDLLALTKALLHLSNRTAWLAILRAPWCGLTLADLLIIAERSANCLWSTLKDFHLLAVSADAQKRLQRVIPILAKVLKERRRMPLASWIEATWIALGGPAGVSNENNLADAQAFFALLQKMAIGDEILDFQSLERQLDQLAAIAQQPIAPYVEIMTIHKAKGLQFDVVILPCLERRTSTDAHQLLVWQERSTFSHKTELLLAPIKQGKEEPIYDYLRAQEANKAQHELARLFYVAVTRAKHELHLLANVTTSSTPHTSLFRKPVLGSLLEQVWQEVEPIFIQHYQNNFSHGEHEIAVSDPSEKVYPSLYRLTNDWHNPMNSPTNNEFTFSRSNRSVNYFWENSTQKYLGTALHLILQKMGHAPETSNKLLPARDDIFPLLQYLGVGPTELENCFLQVERGVKNILNDSKGRWILAPHQEARSEYAITLNFNDALEHLVIDRCFIENGIRWIIDFKTAHYQGEDLELFLNAEQARYREQLEQYARAFRAREKNPIRLGLYFPMMCAWREWGFEE